MGIDICVFMEYRSRKKKRYTYFGKMDSPRLYGIFEFMGKIYKDKKPLYGIRGLPGDVTEPVYHLYKKYGRYAHNASWLTTEEFKNCLDRADEQYSDVASEGWLREYEQIYSYLKDYDNDKWPARIVFWFVY